MLTPAQVQQYRHNGYVLGPRVLSDDQVAELQDETLRVIRDRDNKDVPQPVHCISFGKPENPIWQIVNIYQASAAFRRLLENRVLVDAAAQLSGARELRLWHDQIQYKPPTVGGVNMWHQDSPYWPILEPKDAQITAWIALDEAAADNGCMSMVPGSHRWGNTVEFLHTLKDFAAMPKEFSGRPLDVRLCPVPKGHVHFHHSLTWHGSHANTSGRPRRAIALHFMTEQTRYHAALNHVMKPYVTVADQAKLEGAAFPLVYAAAEGSVPAVPAMAR